MQLFRLARRCRLPILGVCGVAFGVWVGCELARTSQPRLANAPDPNVRSGLAEPGLQSIDAVPPTPEAPRVPISVLKTGMTRAEVEALVGPPAPEHVLPAMVRPDVVTYQTAYEADFGPPPTVRPIRVPQAHPTPVGTPPNGRAVVILEFDASKPGHPLRKIHYPDPSF